MSNNSKQCTKCQEIKPLSDFRVRSKKKGTYQSWCKSCFSVYEKDMWKTSPERRKNNIEKNRERRIRNKQYVWDYLKNTSCKHCGNSDPRVLEFDHLNSEEKLFNISDICNRSHSIKSIKKEIDKCQVLCANCHRIKTYEQLNYWIGVD